MKKLEKKWYENKDWWHFNENGFFEINEDAPEEAKESFRKYREQCKAKRTEMENQNK